MKCEKNVFQQKNSVFKNSEDFMKKIKNVDELMKMSMKFETHNEYFVFIKKFTLTKIFRF